MTNTPIHAEFWGRLAAAGPEVMVHAGDWASTNIDDLVASVAQCREAVRCPILSVLGNHSFWDERGVGGPETLFRRREAFERNEIRYLGDGPVELGGWLFAGFTGWYASEDPPSNDRRYLPRALESDSAWKWLGRRARIESDAALAAVAGPPRRAACVTHFPCWSGPGIDPSLNGDLALFEPLTSRFSLLIAGHTHRACDFQHGACRVLNPGGDYDDPRYVMVDLD